MVFSQDSNMHTQDLKIVGHHTLQDINGTTRLSTARLSLVCISITV